eukprot:350866-Chlamydomonas_euryale.AAC.4
MKSGGDAPASRMWRHSTSVWSRSSTSVLRPTIAPACGGSSGGSRPSCDSGGSSASGLTRTDSAHTFGAHVVTPPPLQRLLLPLLLLLLTVLLERLIPQLPHASSGVPHAGGVFRGAHCSGWSNADGRCMCWWLVAVTSGIGSGATSSDAAAMRNWWRPVRALRPSGQPPGAGALGAGRSNETLQHSGSALGRYGRRGLPERCRRCVSSVGLPLLRWHPTCHLLH